MKSLKDKFSYFLIVSLYIIFHFASAIVSGIAFANLPVGRQERNSFKKQYKNYHPL
ncbi:hypothetical protein [uncultured Dokdonia sp.]|uniref:hypothetical protein n=1 Tax=uncultured Dokdonia sp. TaxID=575653 RepID=UPI002639D7BF|nr:hypothetical protein [uncultured Dokdonia sp.]